MFRGLSERRLGCTARARDFDAVRVGDWVLAIGSPFGLGATVPRGIISAMPRAHLQTDAAATFLDSVGGPLVDAGAR